MSGRKCQVCGTENSEADFFCQNCGTEVSLPAAATAPRSRAPGPAPQEQAQRPCPKCGQLNEPIFALCTRCGFELAEPGSGPSGGKRLLLIVGEETFECKHGDILGREGTVARAFFSTIGTVSRKHVGLTEREGAWFVTVSPAVQNMTQLDGREIPRGVAQPLSGDHMLRLSTQCEVRLKVAG
jgi:hypothetical protein